MQILENHVSGPLVGADLGKDEPMTKTTQKKDKPRSASASENVTHPQMSITNARSPRGRPKDDRASLDAVSTDAKGQGLGDSGDLGRSFSARLRELRRAKGLSLRKLGREIGVTANAVLRWEKDEVTPTRSKMLELSRYFGVEPAWLAWGIGARRNRLKPSDLVSQLEKCDEPQLRAISALLEAFD